MNSCLLLLLLLLLILIIVNAIELLCFFVVIHMRTVQDRFVQSFREYRSLQVITNAVIVSTNRCDSHLIWQNFPIYFTDITLTAERVQSEGKLLPSRDLNKKKNNKIKNEKIVLKIIHNRI